MAVRFALFVCVALAAGCVHRVVPLPPSPTHLWNLQPDADDDDQLCVPADAWTAPGETTACATVGEVRRYLRARRFTE